MTGLELLESYDKAAIVVKQYFLNVMLESLKDENLPESFKEYAREAGIDNDKVAAFIDNQPRGLFDVFDANKIYIGITPNTLIGGMEFKYTIGDISGEYPTRKEAEMIAIEKAFEILNNKL
jgi:hypothetical protein